MHRLPIMLAFVSVSAALAANALAAASPPVAGYCATRIGADFEVNSIVVTELGENSRVAGYTFTENRTDVFQWDRRGGGQFFPELASESNEWASPMAGMNSRGQISGAIPIDIDGETLRAFVWSPGQDLQLLEPAPGDDMSIARDINNMGEVLGVSGLYYVESPINQRTVIWDRQHRVHVLPDFADSTGSYPSDINNAGQVVGSSNTPDGGRGFIWDRSRGIRALPGLPGSRPSIFPQAVNEHGEIAGFTSDSEGIYAVYWSESRGVVKLEGLPARAELAFAHDINNRGQIVGEAMHEESRAAVIWDASGQVFNLNDLLVRSNPEDAEIHLFDASHINDAGSIVARSSSEDGFRHYLLTPARLSSTGGLSCACSE